MVARPCAHNTAEYCSGRKLPVGIKPLTSLVFFVFATLWTAAPVWGQEPNIPKKGEAATKPAASEQGLPGVAAAKSPKTRSGIKVSPSGSKLPNSIERAPFFTQDLTKPKAGSPVATAPRKPRDWRHTKRKPDIAFGAFQRGFFLTAFKEATKRVEKNPDDGAAMALIGEIFKDGLGVRGDKAEAVRWFKLAANRGDREAAFALGRAYLAGQGTKKDIALARKYFEQAAAKGHGAALYNLGIMEIGGDPRRKTGNFEKAADYFRKGAAEGSMDAVYSLAILYRRGAGVLRDDIKSSQFLKQAADRDHLAAMTEYAIALFNGRGVRKDEKGAAVYLIKAAWRNSPIAQNRLARLYVIGRGVKKDIVQAMKWHVIARATGVKDKWLDSKLPTLTRTQRKIVGLQVRKFAGK